jgi:uncharacterized membrane protein
MDNDVLAAAELGATPRPRRARPTRFRCAVCGKEKPARDVTSIDVVRPSLLDRIRTDHPDLPAEGYICEEDLDRFRSRYVAEMLGQERGELSRLEQEVVQSLADHETLAENIEEEYSGQRTFGERVSDRLASFGGSWTFIGIFFAMLVVWMAFNVWATSRDVFDPYPFILLNLVLSFQAAYTGPVVMMSENRQAAKDRDEAEHDFEVNRRALVLLEELQAGQRDLRSAIADLQRAAGPA